MPLPVLRAILCACVAAAALHGSAEVIDCDTPSNACKGNPAKAFFVDDNTIHVCSGGESISMLKKEDVRKEAAFRKAMLQAELGLVGMIACPGLEKDLTKCFDSPCAGIVPGPGPERIKDLKDLINPKNMKIIEKRFDDKQNCFILVEFSQEGLKRKIEEFRDKYDIK